MAKGGFGKLIAWLVGARTEEAAVRVREASALVATQPDDVVAAEMRRLGPVASSILGASRAVIIAGKTTADVAASIVDGCRAHDVEPAMLGYNGFPAAAAVSVNDEIVHGIPSSRRLSAGDLVKVEVGVTSGKAFAAQSWTFPVGELSAADARMLEVGRNALRAAVAVASPSARLGDVAAAIQSTAEADELSVVRAYVGYGMGKARIGPPQIHGYGRTGTGMRMRRGSVLNLHVILKRGSHEVEVAADEWSALAADGERGVLFTSMVEVTSDGHLELTRDPDT